MTIFELLKERTYKSELDNIRINFFYYKKLFLRVQKQSNYNNCCRIFSYLQFLITCQKLINPCQLGVEDFRTLVLSPKINFSP